MSLATFPWWVEEEEVGRQGAFDWSLLDSIRYNRIHVNTAFVYCVMFITMFREHTFVSTGPLLGNISLLGKRREQNKKEIETRKKQLGK